jgi:D-serine deaminase-like pyridoxal phosphate-dependent protein
MTPAYELRDPSAVPSPSLLFYPALIRRNIARVIELAGGPDRLRPHAKTHKTREITKLQLAAGVTKHKCATIAEAEMLADCGVPDVLLAYPAIGPNAVRLARLAAKFPGTQFSSLVDSEVGLAGLADAAKAAKVTLEILVDVDVGQHRTGIVPEKAGALYAAIARHAVLRPNGLHAYDGHNKSEQRTDRDKMAADTLKQIVPLRAHLEKQGLPVPRLVVGGTPGFPSYAAIRDVPGLECSPGTYVLHDHGYGSLYPDLTGVTPAALVLTRVVSKPAGGHVTFDVGTKSIASDPPAGKRLRLLNIAEYTPVGHNEEHFIVQSPHADEFSIGQVCYAMPAHVCPTVALHKYALTVEDGLITGQWEIVARDRMLTV